VSGHPVRRLGLVLGALLQTQGTPAELRLFVSRATSEPPLYQTVDEFSSALAYFERPDRPQILRDVYEKVAHGPALPAAPPVETRPASAPRRQLTRAQILLGIGLTAALVVAAIVSLAPASSAWSSAQVTSAFSALKASIGTRVDQGLQSGRSLLAEVGLMSATPPAPAPAIDPKPVTAAPVKRSAPPASAAAPPPGITAADIRRVEIGKPAPSRGLAVSGAEQPVDGPRPPDPAVYPTTDVGVIPPTLIYPALPRDPPADVDPGKVSVLEVVVDEDGFVSALKLLTPPGRFEDRMLLSAVKAWRFRPAMRDGRPVKFRHLIRLTH
jgi:hypothetical protein